MPRRSRKQRVNAGIAARFKTALKNKGISAREWCRTQAPCSRYHLYECFAGRRAFNDEITAALDALINEQAA